MLHLLVDGLRDLLNRLFCATGLLLHLFRQQTEFFYRHVARDVGFDAVDVALRTPPQQTKRTRHLGQALRADDDESHHQDHHQL